MRLQWVILIVLLSSCTKQVKLTPLEQYARSTKAIHAACAGDLIPSNKRTECITDLMNVYIGKLYPEVKE